MSLGYSVADLLPRARGSGALRMGLTRLAEQDWRDPAGDLAARQRAFAADPAAVAVLPEGREPAREAAALMAGCDDLGAAARQGWEDACVLTADDQGAYRLVAGAVAFPTDWALADKLGLAMPAIHAPIHGYAEQLSAGVDHFMANLNPGDIWGRANWFVVASDDWRYCPAGDPADRFAGMDAANAGDRLFVRCERQTLRRLPRTGAILFLIGIYLAPLRDLGSALLARLAEAVGSLGTGEHSRRAAPHYAAALSGYAAARA